MLPLLHSIEPPRPLILAHTMPWFEAPPTSRQYGWHWTMGKLQPPKESASFYHPLMGLYNSHDAEVAECQVQLMKLAGIDGALVDWYGNVDQWDYLFNHENTQLLFRTLGRAKMKFGIVYEDQTVPQLIKGGKFAEADAVAEGAKLMQWVEANWFSSPAYLRVDGRPVFLVFGPQYYKEADWPQLFDSLKSKPFFYTLHYRRSTADSAYDWPLPDGGTVESEVKRRSYFDRSKDYPSPMPVAYPRFRDYYRAAGLDYGHGVIDDLDGKTFRVSLKEALASKPPFVQIATWNDWGEGTQIEPSMEFGYRDLEEVQRQRRGLGTFPYTAADLRLPIQLYKLRRSSPRDPKTLAKLAKISDLLLAGNPKAARKAILSFRP